MRDINLVDNTFRITNVMSYHRYPNIVYYFFNVIDLFDGYDLSCSLIN